MTKVITSNILVCISRRKRCVQIHGGNRMKNIYEDVYGKPSKDYSVLIAVVGAVVLSVLALGGLYLL